MNGSTNYWVCAAVVIPPDWERWCWYHQIIQALRPYEAGARVDGVTGIADLVSGAMEHYAAYVASTPCLICPRCQAPTQGGRE